MILPISERLRRKAIQSADLANQHPSMGGRAKPEGQWEWEMAEEVEALEEAQETFEFITSFTHMAALKKKDDDITKLRCALDNIKIRAYELGQRKLHDMAWKALK